MTPSRVNPMDIRTLTHQLRQPGVRFGIGLWLLPPTALGLMDTFAARLNLHPVDARLAYISQLPAGAHYSGLTQVNGHHKLLDLFRHLASETHPRDCLLIHTLDIMLWGLEVDERERFWNVVFEGLPYPRTRLVLTLPQGSSALLDHSSRQRYTAYLAEGLLE